MPSGRRKLVVATAIIVVLAGLFVGGARVSAEMDAERIFREAREYTVRVQTRIETPFISDDRGSSEGAGFLIDPVRGWILTNAHVVGQSPSEVQIAFAGEEFQTVDKVYVDPFADVAVLALRNGCEGRTAARLATNDAVRVGEPIGAFGHPLGMYFTGTRGIVSGTTDQFGADFIQIDATVDHGNSGGPTIALHDGRVIGIATARSSGDKSDRVNFATPIHQANRILELLRQGVVPSPPLPRLAFLRDETGSHTLEIAQSFDRARWPLEPGDRILAVEGREVKTLSDLVNALRGCKQATAMTVERVGRTATVQVLPELADEVLAERGLSIDGALVAPITFEDADAPDRRCGLFVQSIQPGSPAEMMELGPGDRLHTVDGRRFGDLDSLRAYVEHRPGKEPLKVIVTRTSPFMDRWNDYLIRELPGTDVEMIGPKQTMAAKQG